MLLNFLNSDSASKFLSLQTSNKHFLMAPVHTLSSPELVYIHVSSIYTIGCCSKFRWHGVSQVPFLLHKYMRIAAMFLWYNIFLSENWNQQWPHVVVLPLLLSHVRLFATPWTAAWKPGFSVLDYLPQLAQNHVHWVDDAIQAFHPLLFPSPALNLSQHQGIF